MTTDPAAPPPNPPRSPSDGAAHNHLVQTIAHALATGLKHPGNPTTGQPPQTILLPMFRTAGMAPQMAAAIQQTTTHIAEAIANLIETTPTPTEPECHTPA